MEELRSFIIQLGFGKVQTLLRTGNVVFEGPSRKTSELEKLLESEARNRLALETDFFVRAEKEWRELTAANPFPAAAKEDPGHLVVMFLKNRPSPEALEELRSAIKGRETVETVGKEAYLVYPDGIGRSRLTTGLIEKKLETRGTGRNWNTVLKLGSIASASD